MFNIKTQEELDKKLDFTSMALPVRGNQWHAIYSFELMRVLAVSSWLSTVNSMSHYHINSYAWYSINTENNDFKQPKIPKNFDTVNTWRWKYSLRDQVFEEDIADLTYDQIFYLKLTREKSAALDTINRNINNIRRAFIPDVNGQHQIYRYKEQEAREILETADENLDPDRFIFINEYARLTGVDIKIAAREVILQSDFAKSRFADTETIRIKYSRAVNHAKEFPEISGLVASFFKDIVGYARS